MHMRRRVIPFDRMPRTVIAENRISRILCVPFPVVTQAPDNLFGIDARLIAVRFQAERAASPRQGCKAAAVRQHGCHRAAPGQPYPLPQGIRRGADAVQLRQSPAGPP